MPSARQAHLPSSDRARRRDLDHRRRARASRARPPVRCAEWRGARRRARAPRQTRGGLTPRARPPVPELGSAGSCRVNRLGGGGASSRSLTLAITMSPRAATGVKRAVRGRATSRVLPAGSTECSVSPVTTVVQIARSSRARWEAPSSARAPPSEAVACRARADQQRLFETLAASRTPGRPPRTGVRRERHRVAVEHALARREEVRCADLPTVPLASSKVKPRGGVAWSRQPAAGGFEAKQEESPRIVEPHRRYPTWSAKCRQRDALGDTAAPALDERQLPRVEDGDLNPVRRERLSSGDETSDGRGATPVPRRWKPR